MQCGAQGYLSKNYFSNSLVAYSLRNIIQRKVIEESLFIERIRAEITFNSISDVVISTNILGGRNMKRADIAMYHAKERGRNNYQFFKDDMNVRVFERLATETRLRYALKRQEFVLQDQSG